MYKFKLRKVTITSTANHHFKCQIKKKPCRLQLVFLDYPFIQRFILIFDDSNRFASPKFINVPN